MFTRIPLIEVGPFLNGRDEDRQRILREIGDAWRNVRIFYLSNHAVSSSLIDNLKNVVRKVKLTKFGQMPSVLYSSLLNELR